jgi:Type II secretion system (T2SS), protein E, N-terminal domain
MSLSFLSFLPGVDRGLRNMKAVCDLPSCHNKQLMRTIPGARPGIQVGAQWYCSVDCFAFASRVPLAALSFRRGFESARKPRLSLGLALLSKGILKAEDLRATTAEGQLDEEELAEMLVRTNMASEKQIAAARSQQWGYPVFAQDFSGQLVFSDIPRALLRACSAAPLHYSTTMKRILLGFVSRIEHSLLESVEQMTGCRVEPCFVTPSDCEEQISRVTAPPDYEEQVIEEPGPPEKMARTVGRAAVEIGAREASFTQCRNHVWARIAGKRGRVDIVFRPGQVPGEEIFKNSDFLGETATLLG